MGHYLSDFLPDPSVVCLKCMEGIFPAEQTAAWGGYLDTCECKNPEPCSVKDVESYETPTGFRWRRKKHA